MINTVSLLNARTTTANKLASDALIQRDIAKFNKLRSKELDAVVKMTSYGGLLGNLSIFQSTVERLKKMNSELKSATVSDSTFLTATAAGWSTFGNHTVQVGNIATAQTINSGVYAAQSSAVADLGTYATQKLNIQVGSGTAKEITVDSSNNTLTGIKESINNASAGVTATVENSGFTVDASNNTIKFDFGGTTKTATIATGTYTSSGLGKAIKTALESANGGYDTYTVSYDDTTNKFTIKNNATNSNTIDILWENAETTAGSLLGFSAADHTSITAGSTAVSDNAVLGTGYSLVLTANSTGADNKIIVKADVNNDGTYSEAGIESANSGLSALAFNATGGITNMSQSTAAINSTLKVDGIEYTRSNNNISDLISGVTLNLIKGDPFYSSSPTTLDLSVSNMMLVGNLKMFASSYNSTISYIKTLGEGDESEGALKGDAVLEEIEQAIKGIKDQKTVTSSGLQSLSYIGINFDVKGKMTIDETKLKNSIMEDSIGVSNIATQMGLSLYRKLDNHITSLLPEKRDEAEEIMAQSKKEQILLMNKVKVRQATFAALHNSVSSIFDAQNLFSQNNTIGKTLNKTV
ncbi:MAG: flagellar filament capping protein FliD [Nitrospirae bacterium]|nr:flagellar filament capping protein FliD [Nitrospirota bacterium]